MQHKPTLELLTRLHTALVAFIIEQAAKLTPTHTNYCSHPVTRMDGTLTLDDTGLIGTDPVISSIDSTGVWYEQDDKTNTFDVIDSLLLIKLIRKITTVSFSIRESGWLLNLDQVERLLSGIRTAFLTEFAELLSPHGSDILLIQPGTILVLDTGYNDMYDHTIRGITATTIYFDNSEFGEFETDFQRLQLTTQFQLLELLREGKFLKGSDVRKLLPEVYTTV